MNGLVVARRARLDAELVRRGLVRSREQAGTLIAAGRVLVNGTAATKAATAVSADAPVRVVAASDGPDYVSRGGHKLGGALDRFAGAVPPLRVSGRRCLDAGASTGGFTDALLRRDAAHVVAVDVGYGQLAWTVRTDPRVTVLERTNARTLTPEQIGGAVELTVADLSFISLRTVLPALAACTRADGDLVLLVKPQFEVGREALGKGGVVREPGLRVRAIVDVAASAAARGLVLRDVVASALPGPSGNVEFLAWFGGPASTGPGPVDAAAAAARAVAEAPA